MNFEQRLKEAKSYISFCLKEGVSWDEEELLDMSDEELVKFAEYEMAKGDYYANSQE